MTVKLIGGSGFIGTRLGHRLVRSGTPFEVLDIEPSQAFPGRFQFVDVRDLPALTKAVSGGTTIINLAAAHRDDVRPVSLYDAINVEGARNVCSAADAAGIRRIVFTSSVACYGFAAPNTGEDGPLAPFNDYGRTKAEAEAVFRAWHAIAPAERTLVIVRPTVVFGEGNRGNLYNLLHQIASGRFVMVGTGQNKKSIAYVENVAAFLEFTLGFSSGFHLYNYVDKPDFDVATLVALARDELGKHGALDRLRLPYSLGYAAGRLADVAARLTGRQLPLSAVRIKKFVATTQFATRVPETGFVPPVALDLALRQTIRHEFLGGSSP